MGVRFAKKGGYNTGRPYRPTYESAPPPPGPRGLSHVLSVHSHFFFVCLVFKLKVCWSLNSGKEKSCCVIMREMFESGRLLTVINDYYTIHPIQLEYCNHGNSTNLHAFVYFSLENFCEFQLFLHCFVK